MLLDLADRLVVVIGGGSVAVRKVGGLMAAGAMRVRVVAPRVDPNMPDGIDVRMETYRPEHLVGATLVFAATDDRQINDAVVRDARKMNLLVNRADADDEAPGDFTTPAVHWSGPIMLSVSAAGNPALAVRIRDELAGQIDARWVAMVVAMARLRPAIRQSGLTIDRRRAIFRWLATDEAMNLLEKEGIEELIRRVTTDI